MASMAYAVFFLALGAYCLTHALLADGLVWLWLWLGVSFGLVGSAYLGLGPRMLGKRSDGRIAWWAVLFFLPYLLPTWLVWHILRFSSREDCCNEIAPRLWLGRRPLAHELRPGTDLIVDLTSEFTAPVRSADGRTYRCVPVLDGSVPMDAVFRQIAEEIAAWPGQVYIHCAMGHGRSATVAAAVLLLRGIAADPRESVALLRKARPGVGLGRVQRRMLDRFAAQARHGASVKQQTGVGSSFACASVGLLVDRASLPDRLAALEIPGIAGPHRSGRDAQSTNPAAEQRDEQLPHGP
jgi:protein-tyrosine phosphatase